MGEILYAIAIRKPDGKRDFQHADRNVILTCQSRRRLMNSSTTAPWLGSQIVFCQPRRSIRYRTMTVGTGFTVSRHGPRCSHRASFSRMEYSTAEFCNLIPEVRAEIGNELGDAVLAVLALIQGKALNWNARASSGNRHRQKMRSLFEKHNFSFKWTFAEFEGAQALYPWCRERLSPRTRV